MASASQGSQSSKTTPVVKKTGGSTKDVHADKVMTVDSDTRKDAKIPTWGLVIKAEQFEEASKQIVEESTENFGNEDGNLPFEKKNTFLWSMLESMEIFQKLPQKPHFRALEQLSESFREGQAIGYMVNFCSVLERSSRLQFLNEPKSSTSEILENLFKLEENGFNVEFVRERIAMREKLEKLQEQFEEVKGEIGKRIAEKDKIEEHFEAMKEAKDHQIASLKLKKIVLEEDIADVEREFLTSVASLGITVGVNLDSGSISTEPNWRKVGLKACSNIKWNNQVLSTEVTSQVDSSPILETNGNYLVSVKYESNDRREFVSEAKDMVILKDLDAGKNPIGQLSSSGVYGSVTRRIEGLSQRKKVAEGSRSLILMEKAFPEIIHLEDDNDSLERGAAPEEKLSRPISFIDLEEDEDQDTRKNLCAMEAIDLRESAVNLVETELEAQGYADLQEKRKVNHCHATQTEVYTVEGAISSGQATFKDDKVRVRGAQAGVTSHGVINASPGEKDLKADMEEESNEKIHEATKTTRCDIETINWQRVFDEIKRGNKGTKFSPDDASYVSKLAKGKGVYAWTEDDANMEEESSKKSENAEEQSQAYDDVANVSNVNEDKGEFIGVEDNSAESDSSQDDLAVWDEMSLMLTENWKDCLVESSSADHTEGGEGAKACEHQFIFKDDIGTVCRVCGLIEKRIDTIIEYQFGKGKGSGRTYKYERPYGDGSYSTSEVPVPDGIRLSENFLEVPVHPRHRKFMKAHQFEGLNFLLSNVMAENPGGCVMAHAPGSGKTFMMISFLQVFMAKYPSARPLIVLPMGILSTWKKEFQKWQVEDMPLYDFYSSKAESRSQQLEVLRKWGKERSILFLSYKQFTVIVRDGDDSKTNEECREFLLVSPSILILDEGHTTRNDDTEALLSVKKVKTPRKVVLSGTLYQNHVKEVFNVLNLVRPKFLKTDPASSIKRRIMSKVELSGKRISMSDDQFYEAVERTILDNIELKRKDHVIQDLREMTSNVLHYYKGDSLDELPGLVDFTVFLKLSEGQKKDIEVLKKCNSRFKILSEGSVIYVHPRLNAVLKQSRGDGKVDVEKIDLLLQNPSEMGAKARFYLNLLKLCESTGEKLLVFSQYLGPLKFLERLTVKAMNYTVGREIFVITGDSNSDIRDSSMQQFNTSSSSRVFFGSIKACGEGISLVGASRIIILDIHLNPSVTRQAIGRAFRPGQERKVYTYRLVAAGSPEEEDHLTCFRKECIAKMWFEWNAYRGLKEFEMAMVDVNNCGDMFLEMTKLNAEVVSVGKRWSDKEAEKQAFSFVPILSDGTAEKQLQVLTNDSDKLDSLGSGGQLEIKSGEEVHRKKGRSPKKLLSGCVLSGNNGVVEGSKKPGYSGSDEQLEMKTGEEVQKRKGGKPKKILEGSNKPGYSDGQLQMKEIGEKVQKRKGGRPRKILEESEKPGYSDGQLKMKKTGEEVQKRKGGRPRKNLAGSEKPGCSDGQLQMEKTGEEVQKRKGGRPRKILEGSEKPGYSDGQLKMKKTGEEVQKRKGGRPRKNLEGSEKPGCSDGQLQMKKIGEEVQKRKRGRPRKFLEGSEKPGYSDGQLQMKSGEEVQKRKMGRPGKVLDGGNTGVVEGYEKSNCTEIGGELQMKTAGEEEKDSSTDEFMLPSNVLGKRKKRTVLESNAKSSLPRSHKRTKTEKDVQKKLVGSRVKVWWPDDQQYYEGIIESYDSAKKKHKVAYLDGDVENLILSKERWLRVDERSDNHQVQDQKKSNKDQETV